MSWDLPSSVTFWSEHALWLRLWLNISPYLVLPVGDIRAAKADQPRGFLPVSIVECKFGHRLSTVGTLNHGQIAHQQQGSKNGKQQYRDST